MIELNGQGRYVFMGRKVRTSRGIGRLVGYRFNEEDGDWDWVVKLDKDAYMNSLAPGEENRLGLQVGRVVQYGNEQVELEKEES